MMEMREEARRGGWLLGFVYLLYYLVVGPFQLVLGGRCVAMGLGAQAGAWALGFLYGTLGLSRLMAGPVTERLQARRTLIVVGLLLALAVGMTFNVSRPWLLYAGMALIGLGSALLWSAGGALALALAKVERHGTAASRLYAFTGVGLVIGALSVDWILPAELRYHSSAFSWLQIGWVAIALAATLVAWMLPVRADHAPSLVHPWQVFRRLLHAGGGRIFGLLAGAAISYGVFYSLVTPLIERIPAVNEHLGTISLPLYAVMAFSSLLVGPLSDRIGRRPVLLTGTLVGAAGFAMLATVAAMTHVAAWQAWGLIGGGCFGLGWCFASVQSMAMAWVGDHVRQTDRSTSIGLLFIGRDFGVTAAAGASVMATVLGQRAGWGDGFTFAFAIFALTLLLLSSLAVGLRK